jgi:hypothetical protein
VGRVGYHLSLSLYVLLVTPLYEITLIVSTKIFLLLKTLTGQHLQGICRRLPGVFPKKYFLFSLLDKKRGDVSAIMSPPPLSRVRVCLSIYSARAQKKASKKNATQGWGDL